MEKPLDLDAARKRIRQIVMAKGNIALPNLYTDHADDRAAERGITSVQVYNVLKSGAVVGVDLGKWAWRYRVEANNLRVVVEFAEDAPESELCVVTVIRLG